MNEIRRPERGVFQLELFNSWSTLFTLLAWQIGGWDPVGLDVEDSVDCWNDADGSEAIHRRRMNSALSLNDGIHFSGQKAEDWIGPAVTLMERRAASRSDFCFFISLFLFRALWNWRMRRVIVDQLSRRRKREKRRKNPVRSCRISALSISSSRIKRSKDQNRLLHRLGYLIERHQTFYFYSSFVLFILFF